MKEHPTPDKLVVNLLTSPRRLRMPNQELVMYLFGLFLDYYHLDDPRADMQNYFLRNEGVEHFVKWLKEHCNLTATPFNFTVSQNKTTFGFGFVFDNDANLTAYLLKANKNEA